MPIYEYQCRDCGHAFETMQRLAEAPLTECPQCKGSLKKLISAPAFQFKGSGWYVTDYSRSGGGGGGGTDKGPGDASAKSEGAGKSEGGSEAKSGESSATKVETPSASPKPSSTSD